jgi:peptidoglycan/LPS O-acetylase OafA/YrhL
MAKSIYKKAGSEVSGEFAALPDRERADDYVRFMVRKYKRIFPQHAVAFCFAFMTFVLWNHLGLGRTLVFAVKNIPAFFLVQKTGFIPASVNSITWYLSCMLIAMAVIYPAARRHYYVFTRYIAPVAAILILGWMYHASNDLTGTQEWLGIAFKCTFRALSELMLGMTSFEISRALAEKYGEQKSAAATVLELLCLIGSIGYMVITAPRSYEMYVLVMLFIVVTIAFSGISYGSEIFDSNISYFLGKISLPIYLSQLSAIYFVNWLIGGAPVGVKIAAASAVLACITPIVMVLGDALEKKLPVLDVEKR